MNPIESFLLTLTGYTKRNYQSALTAFIEWYKARRVGEEPIAWAGLDRDVFRSYLARLVKDDYSASAIHLRFSALRSFYKFMIDERLAPSGDPTQGIKLPKGKKKIPKFLTEGQAKLLLHAPIVEFLKGETKNQVALIRDAAILECIYSAGLRISECCGLRADSLSFTDGWVKVLGKGEKERIIPIGIPALNAIVEYWKLLEKVPKGSAPVFYCDDEVEPIYPRLVQLRLKRYLLAAGLDPEVTPHKLRHSYATHLLDNGADIRAIQELLGHENISTTQIYTHVNTKRLKQVHEQSHPRSKEGQGEQGVSGEARDPEPVHQ